LWFSELNFNLKGVVMKFDYSFKPKKEQVVVSLLIEESLHDFYQTTLDKFIGICDFYGISSINYNGDLTAYNNCLIKHAIIIERSNNPLITTLKYRHLLDWYDHISLGLIYENQKKMLECKLIVDNLKLQYKDKINYLRPDVITADGICCISNQKILDNIICDTIRIKYNPKQLSSRCPPLTDSLQQYFLELSKMYTEYHLYHRSPSDGFFAARYGDGFFITASKTNKSSLSLDRISYIHDYDENENILSYSGNFLPSSDGVEATIVFMNNPAINSIVHTHASDFFTRNEAYKSKIKVGIASYGIPQLGYDICKVAKDHYDDFLIMEEHGELFLLSGLGVAAINKFNEIIQRELSQIMADMQMNCV